jgi:rRNA maturation protein Nop10
MSRGSVSSRLERLEASARSGLSGRCTECGLGPRETGYIVLCGNDPAEHLPEVCPECGRSTKIRIKVVYEGGEGEGVIADA